MSNHITIELCAEDRARLDSLNERIEALIDLAQYALDHGVPTKTKATAELTDPIKKALAEVVESSKPTLEEVAEAEKSTQDEPKEETPTITPTEEETPKEEACEPPAPVRTVTRAELGTKVRELMTKGFKEPVKEIVKCYATTVPGVPEDKVTECYERLVALEEGK